MTNCAFGRGYADTLVMPRRAAHQRRPAVYQPRPGADDGDQQERLRHHLRGDRRAAVVDDNLLVYHHGFAGLLRRWRRRRRRTRTGMRYFGTNEGQSIFEDADASPSAVAFDVFPSRAATNGTAIK